MMTILWKKFLLLSLAYVFLLSLNLSNEFTLLQTDGKRLIDRKLLSLNGQDSLSRNSNLIGDKIKLKRGGRKSIWENPFHLGTGGGKKKEFQEKSSR